jgi:hypothetical protein
MLGRDVSLIQMCENKIIFSALAPRGGEARTTADKKSLYCAAGTVNTEIPRTLIN